MRRRLNVLAALATVAIASAGAAAPASARQAGCSPGEPAGAPGVGDEYYPTYGNGGYDVGRYDLEVAYDPSSQRITRGEATISARATQSVCSFNLDLVGLDVSSVSVDGRRAQFARTDHELTVTPRQSLERGRRFEVEIRYAGEPTEFLLPGTDIRTGFMDTPDGATVAGQPEVAAGWFPVNDHPRDKAAYSFEITVPDGYEVVANGFLRDVDRRGRHATWEWDAPEAMASYLATIDIGFWDVRRWRTDDGLPVYDAVDSAISGELREQIDSSLARQGEVLDLLTDAFGPYPFRTVGGIVDNQDDLFFALETQTRPVYSKLFWLDRDGNAVNGDPVVVHELAHQWFGDDVALHKWQDIWLNEGFATYAEWLWSEHEGQGTPQEVFEATYNSIPANDPFWRVVIGAPGVDLLFDNAVYVRGAMAVQALRNEVGDEAFFEILHEWNSRFGGGTGTTDQFIALAEEIADEQLDAVFDAWLFTAGRPAFSEPSGRVARQAGARAPSSRAAVLDRLERLGRY